MRSLIGFGTAFMMGILLWGNPSNADFMVFTSRANFDNAVAMFPSATEDFSSSPVGPLDAGSTDIGLFNIFIDNPDDTGTLVVGEEFNGFLSDGGTELIRFDFDSSVVAFGADFTSTTTGDLLTLDVNGQIVNFQDWLGLGIGDGFLGVVDTDGFTSVTFGRENPSTFGEFYTVDNVSIAFVPEPSGFGIAWIAAAICLRRRRS